MLRNAPQEMMSKALELSNQTTDFVICNMLQAIAQGQRVAPDDWALVQESLPAEHPITVFFKKHRKDISRQLIVENKIYTSVPIITFTHEGERYVLLLENKGMASSEKVMNIQWTAHGARVDNNERELLKEDPSEWDLMLQICDQDINMTYMLAAAVRRIRGMNLPLSREDIARVHLIDRVGAGLPEVDPFFRTEYFFVDLGEKDPQAVLQACHHDHSTRYGRWTHCLKISELQSRVHNDTGEFTYQGNTYPVRFTTMNFVRALSMLKDFEIKAEQQDEVDLWAIKNIGSFERALLWVQNRADKEVQVTLFSELNSFSNSAKLHAYAAKAKLNEENLAYTYLKPERLALHAVIAGLTVKTIIKNTEDMEKKVEDLYEVFLQSYALKLTEWHQQYLMMRWQLSKLVFSQANSVLTEDERLFIAAVNATRQILIANELDAKHRTIYHLFENDLEIAFDIQLHDRFHKIILPEINQCVNALIDQQIKEGSLLALECYPLTSRQFFGVTGPVASGKSVSEKMARDYLQGRSAAFISSDEWNNILSRKHDLTGFQGYGGKLTLAEAWYIKCLIWENIQKLEASGYAPNWIQEACDPASIKIPEQGDTVIFINTSTHTQAAARVKKRGQESGRYVSASAASGSYRWPWLNVIKTIERNKQRTNLRLQIMDTDVMYADFGKTISQAERRNLANIATFAKGELTIHHIERFITFIQRSFKVTPWPKNASEIWHEKPIYTATKLLAEVNKLTQLAIPVNVDLYEACLKRFRFENFINKRTKNMLSRETLLNYYGANLNHVSQRAALAITGVDEWQAIQQSINIMEVIFNNDQPDKIVEKLMSYGVVVRDEKDRKSLLDNIHVLIKMRDELKKKYKADRLVDLFLLSDLGKIQRFVADFKLGSEPYSASAHEFYLEQWLSNYPELQAQFHETAKWIDIFDGLGQNANSLTTAGYTSVLTDVERALTQYRTQPGSEIERNITAINFYLFNKVKALNLDLNSYDFLIANKTRTKSWKHLSCDQQNKAVMLVLCCPFVFVKPPRNMLEDSREFIQLWQHSDHSLIVEQMTRFMVDNIFNHNPIWLYNLTGLIHHKQEQGGSHFANGGNVSELFTVLFPFVLSRVSQETIEGKFTFNKFQFLQGIELLAEMPMHLANETAKVMASIDFAAPTVKQVYLEKLQQHQTGYLLMTDIGGDIDDVFALLTSVKIIKEAPLLGVIANHIDPVLKARIAKLILTECGLPNIPVYPGIGCKREDGNARFIEQNPLFPIKLFGAPMKENDLKEWHPAHGKAYQESYGDRLNDTTLVTTQTAAEFIVATAKKYSAQRKLTLVAIGPMHDLAAALELEPSIADKIKLVAMGGLYPKGYNWLIAPQVTAKILAMVETICIDNKFIMENKFILNPDDIQFMEMQTTTKLGRTIINDCKNWIKADQLKQNVMLYDPVTLLLATVYQNQICGAQNKQVTFTCLDEAGKLLPGMRGRNYLEPGLDNQIVSAVEVEQGGVCLVTQVNDPELIRSSIVSAIRAQLSVTLTANYATVHAVSRTTQSENSKEPEMKKMSLL